MVSLLHGVNMESGESVCLYESPVPLLQCDGEKILFSTDGMRN